MRWIKNLLLWWANLPIVNSEQITNGRIYVGELDEMVLIILAIVEAIGYVYGVIAFFAGSGQTHSDRVSEYLWQNRKTECGEL